MLDWKKLVRERLGSAELPQDVHDEVVAEIASHLEDQVEYRREDRCEDPGEDQGEDRYENHVQHQRPHIRSHELSASDATNRALSGVPWRKLARAIHHAKLKEESMNHSTMNHSTMNRRTKELWLPAMANLTIAAALLIAFGILGLKDRSFPVSQMAMAIPFSWLFALPISGAAGGLLAKRAHAPLASRLIAGLAPSLVWLAVFCVMPLVFLLDRWQFSEFPLPLDYFILSAAVWIVLPVFPLLLGTLPFLRESQHRKAQPHAG